VKDQQLFTGTAADCLTKEKKYPVAGFQSSAMQGPSPTGKKPMVGL
jgi:hypothetical protein